MRIPSVAGAVLALCAGVFGAESNLTEPRLTQKIITGDFQPPQVFENTNLVRTINLEKGYVRETTNVLITNTDKAAQSDYYIPFEYDLMGKIGGFDARDKKNPDIPLEVTIAALSGVLDDHGGSSKYAIETGT
jgi:oligosaccharyltransferase complex subunit alpha (ribophorin I)